MLIERPYGDKNKTILCNVPPMLPGNTLSQTVNFNACAGINQSFGTFSIGTFMARYLAGNRSLKEERLISRKRLALVSSGVGYFDPQAYELHNQIGRYVAAKKALVTTKLFTAESILTLNKLIAKEKNSTGKIRTVQNWIGSKNVFDARYICPPPDMVPGLFDNWLTFINSNEYSCELRAIVGHCRLASIHPFVEGNGRTARVFMDGMLEQHYGDRVPLLIYRLSPTCPPKAYIEAQELLNVDDANGLAHPFWGDALTWTKILQSQVSQILSDTQKTINSKIGLSMISLPAIKLLNHLWAQPIVCHRGLMKLFSSEPSAVNVAINELAKVGILYPRRLREPANTLIHDCPLIFAAYTAIDDAIFAAGV